MTACFADTFYCLALLNSRDDSHQKALAIAQSLHRPIVTSVWVLTELADGLANTPGRTTFPRFLQRFRNDPRAEVVAMDR
jgi:predicted nucleic acid-binding protein